MMMMINHLKLVGSRRTQRKFVALLQNRSFNDFVIDKDF